MTNQNELLTVPEAAKLLRIGRNLAYELVARGEIPSVRLGRVIRIPRTALEQWLEAGALAGADGGGSPPGLYGLTDATPRRPPGR
jgi:excisionase family DNA binding protein